MQLQLRFFIAPLLPLRSLFVVFYHALVIFYADKQLPKPKETLLPPKRSLPVPWDLSRESLCKNLLGKFPAIKGNKKVNRKCERDAEKEVITQLLVPPCFPCPSSLECVHVAENSNKSDVFILSKSPKKTVIFSHNFKVPLQLAFDLFSKRLQLSFNSDYTVFIQN